MKTKNYKFVYLGILLLSIGSFIFLNTCTEASVASNQLLEKSSFQLPDAKVTKLLLQHVINFLHG